MFAKLIGFLLASLVKLAVSVIFRPLSMIITCVKRRSVKEYDVLDWIAAFITSAIIIFGILSKGI